MRKTSICLLIILSVYGCIQSKIKKEYYANRTVKEILSYRHEKLHGKYNAYYENGKIRCTGYFKNGVQDGEWIIWYENGKVMSVSKYNMGKIIFIDAWDEDSNQTIKNCTGTTVLKYPNGQLMSKVSYKNCHMDGQWITWFENGRQESELYYDNGIPVGTWTFWNEDGSVRKVENYDKW